MPTTTEMEQTFRRLLTDHDLPEPDTIEHRRDGSIIAVYEEQGVAVVIDPDDGRDPG